MSTFSRPFLCVITKLFLCRLTNLELLEIQAESMFEREVREESYPKLFGRGGWSDLKIEMLEIVSLLTTWDLFKCTATGGSCRFFQQWTGIDAIGQSPYPLLSLTRVLNIS